MLQPGRENYDLCMKMIVKQFAKMKIQNHSISKIDMELIYGHENTRKYFEDCVSELSLMDNTKFHGPYSFYFVLKNSKDLKTLSNLAKNENFVKNFEHNLDLFNFYVNDLREIFGKAADIRDQSLIVETRLKAIFGDYLPAVVLKKLEDYVMVEDLILDSVMEK